MTRDPHRAAWTEHFAKQGVKVDQASAPKADHHKALGRLKSGERNKTEAAYEQHLELRRQSGEILWYGFQVFTFKLANDTRLTPDFAVLLASGVLEMHDTKGTKRVVRRSGEREAIPYIVEDAKIKLKVAAAQIPVVFKAVYRVDGDWREEEF